MTISSVPAIELVPMDQISVMNPRVRNKKIFKEIVANIEDVGLKRPITVARRQTSDGTRYELVCGQGRLEAYRKLGQREIPAIVVEADSEDCLVMSLVENLARRQHRSIDLLHDIEGMKRRSYSDAEIAGKTGLTIEYVRSVIKLLKDGELRLLRAVEAGIIPVSVAVKIAEADDTSIQQALQHAYETKQLRGRKLILARRLIEQRRKGGKGSDNGTRRQSSLSSDALVRVYRDNVDKKRLLVRKSELTRNRLTFLTEALRKLLADENFITLLRAEKLETMPKNLADRLHIQTAA